MNVWLNCGCLSVKAPSLRLTLYDGRITCTVPIPSQRVPALQWVTLGIGVDRMVLLPSMRTSGAYLVDICALKKTRPTNSVHRTSGWDTLKWPPVEYGNCNKNLKRVEQKSVPTIIRTSTGANFMLPILSATIRCKKLSYGCEDVVGVSPLRCATIFSKLHSFMLKAKIRTSGSMKWKAKAYGGRNFEADPPTKLCVVVGRRSGWIFWKCQGLSGRNQGGREWEKNRVRGIVKQRVLKNHDWFVATAHGDFLILQQTETHTTLWSFPPFSKTRTFSHLDMKPASSDIHSERQKERLSVRDKFTGNFMFRWVYSSFGRAEYDTERQRRRLPKLD